jgi:hypothetical protein
VVLLLAIALGLVALVDRLAEQVEDAPERALSHRHGDRAAGVAHLHAARQAVGGVHGHRADAVVAQVLLHLEHELRGAAVLAGLGLLALGAVPLELDLERVVDLGQVLGREGDLDDHALDLFHGPGVRVAAPLLLCLGLSCCCFH